jgi:putative ABC transport system permease protein
MTSRNPQILFRALRLLWRYRFRSTLLTLSAALGVGGVVCSVNYGTGGSKQILDQIRRMGMNVLIITPEQNRVIAGRARTGGAVTTLVERDYIAIRKGLLTRTRSSAVVTESFRIKASDFSKTTTVFGCESDFFVIKDWPILDGEAFDSAQERSGARIAVVGHTVAVDLFGTSSPVGQRLMINRVPFVVAGVLIERGQGLDVSNEDDQVYVPLTTAMRRLMNVDHYSAIVVEVDSMGSMNAASAQIRSMLRTQHRIRPIQPEDFQIQNQKSLLDTQMAAAGRLDFCVGVRPALSPSPAWESSPSRGSPLKSEHVRSEPVERWEPRAETSFSRYWSKRVHWHLLAASSVSLYLGRFLDLSATR